MVHLFRENIEQNNNRKANIAVTFANITNNNAKKTQNFFRQ